MTEPRIIIVGPGAMGCGVAALLKERGADVALLDYKPDRAAQIARDGIRVEHQGNVEVSRVPCSAVAQELGIADLVIILVKAYSTAQAIRHAAPCVGPKAAVMTLQNGLGNYEAIAEHIAQDKVLAGTIVMGCASVGVGHVRISGVGDVTVGSPFGNDQLAQCVAEALGRLWPAVHCEANIEAALWRKVIANAAVNPLTAITGLPNGALIEDEDLRGTLGAIAREAAEVARATGVEGLDDDPVAAVEEVCRITGENRSSMLQDVQAHRRTEIEQICGEIARRGRAVGVEAPLCQAMTALVKALEGRSNGPTSRSRHGELARAAPPATAR